MGTARLLWALFWQMTLLGGGMACPVKMTMINFDGWTMKAKKMLPVQPEFASPNDNGMLFVIFQCLMLNLLIRFISKRHKIV